MRRVEPQACRSFSVVMPALVAGIHACLWRIQGADGRDKPGHDDGEMASQAAKTKRRLPIAGKAPFSIRHWLFA
jgi:hypothetical protein